MAESESSKNEAKKKTDPGSELREVHERIQLLQREISVRKGGQAQRPPRTSQYALIASCIVSFTLITASGYLGARRSSSIAAAAIAPAPVVATTLPPMRPASEPEEHVVPITENGPLTGLIDEDDQDDLVTLARRRDGLHELVAIDGVSLQPIWRRPLADFAPPSGTRIVLVKSREPPYWPSYLHQRDRDAQILLAEKQMIRSFSMRTGAPLGTFNVSSPVRQLCAVTTNTANTAGTATAAVPMFEHAVFVEIEKRPGVIVDLDKSFLIESLSPAAARAIERCDDRRLNLPHCSPSRVTGGSSAYPCVGDASIPKTATLLGSLHATIETEQTIIQVGFRTDPKLSSVHPPSVIGLFAKKEDRSTITWEGQLALKGDEDRADDVHFTMSNNGSLAIAYRVSGTTLGRLVIREVGGGSEIDKYHSLTFALALSSRIESLKATSSALLLSTSDRIFVLNRREPSAKNEELHEIEASSSP